MTRHTIAAAAALALVCSLAFGASPDGRKTYIVQLGDEPAASYRGGIAGLAATQPAAGNPLQTRSPAAQAYMAYLGQQQRAVAATVPHAPVIANYHAVFNGFAARLTDAEAAALKAHRGVVEVFEDVARKPDTISTPRFLGLSSPGGLWSQTAGGAAIKGENMVIGVVDGGIWPENPSFADRIDGAGVPVFSGGSLAYAAPPASFTGGCVAGEGFSPAIHCNNKLVGAKFYNAGFLASGRSKNWSEFYSPRDSVGGSLAHGGHGDHTASTAAGNANAPAVMGGIAMGPASGMAPRARVAAYKVCWSYDDPSATDGTGSSNSCWTSDSVAAIDDAVKDGVNVINFSISGSQTSVNDPVEQAFYRAALAGVFVAASAGNSGPGNAVAHISPWLTTVAASTHDRVLSADVTLGNGTKYTGASMNVTPLPQTPLVRAQDAGLPGADTTQLRLCYSAPAALDPAKVAGKIVICERGSNARVDKSQAVKNAGGVGMIMKDNGSGLVAEIHAVPTVHVSTADGTAIQTYAVAAGAAATSDMGVFYAGTTPNAPVMAGFSSRGPNQGDANVLKPDLTAPGVDVIAAVSPALSAAQRDQVAAGTLVPPSAWASYQGTSMSSPHVAGLALLLKQAHPGWSPAAIKSALMTTAYSTLDDGLAGMQNGLLPWAQGAGHVKPNSATDPGLVYDAGKSDWVKYQCKVNKAAVTPASDCTTIGTLDETYNLNLPSITVGNVLGATPVTVTRSVTNVGAAAATYTPTATLPGFSAVVTPASLTLNPGETKSFTVKLTRTTAADNAWNYGSLVWKDGTHVVRIPVQAMVGKAISAPAEVTGNTASGTRLITIKTGVSGRLGSVKGGLKDVTMLGPVSLTPSPMNSINDMATACKAGNDLAGMKVHNVNVPANTLVARFALRQQDTNDANDDFDLMVMKADGTNVLYSATDGSNEAVQIVGPAAGSWRACVFAYAGTSPMSYSLSSWVVTPADVGGNFNVLLPGQVYAGSSATVGISWSGLAFGQRTVGAVQYKDPGGAVQASTVVRVEVNGGLPLSDPSSTASAKLGFRQR
ncbi:MAG: S8 family peptidase [Rubrivivax sp.]